MPGWQSYFWFAATLAAFAAARRLQLACGNPAWLHPVLIATLVLLPILHFSGASYASYRAANMPLLFLLGPATVALAVPLFEQRQRLRRIWRPILISVTLGAIVAMLSAVGLGAALGLDAVLLRTLMAKSVTTPIAMGIAAEVGGIPALAAAIVMLVGIIGAVICVPLLDRLRVDDPAARGVAIGLSAHGVGTARALELDAATGAWSGLAMGLTGLITALLAALMLFFL